MTKEEKFTVVESMLRSSIHYCENVKQDYDGPCFDYLRSVDAIEVFTANGKAFYWTEDIVFFAKALSLTQYVTYDEVHGRVYARIF